MGKGLLIIIIFSFFCIGTVLPHVQNKPATSYQKPVFKKLTNNDGLSQGTITEIVQDKQGFIWIGTLDGLNRYDGYDIQVYNHIPGDSLSIPSNQINKIIIDNLGFIWIATDKGLTRLDPMTGIFSNINTDLMNSDVFIQDMALDKSGNIWVLSINNTLIKYNTKDNSTQAIDLPISNNFKFNDQGKNILYIDRRDNIWLGLKSGGLQQFDPTIGKFEFFDLGNDVPDNQNSFNITAIIDDEKGNLWLGSYLRSIAYFDVESKDFVYYKSIPAFQDTLFAIVELCLNKNSLWIGTYDKGLVCFDIGTQKATVYPEGQSKYDLLYNTVKALFFDRDDNLWIGTNGKGINILSAYSKQFYYANNSDESPIGLSFPSVRSVFEDDEGIIWTGGYIGFQKVDMNNNTSEVLLHDIIYSICPDPHDHNILWVGTEGGGIYSYNKSLNKLEQIIDNEIIELKTNLKLNVYGLQVYDLEFENDSLLYAGTNIGLLKVNIRDKSFHLFGFEDGMDDDLPYGRIYTVDFDSNGILRVASGSNGIFEFSAKENTFVRPFEGRGDFPNGIVFCIHESKDNKLWLGTDNGLCLMDENTQTYKYYTIQDGMPNNVVYAILEDGSGNLWFSTNQGISKFNPSTGIFVNFDESDGLPCNEFNSKAFYQSDNYFYFGGVNGLVIFNPDKILVNELPPSIAITRILKFMKSERIETFCLMENSITINPEENIIELGFSAMDFVNPTSCRYKYRIVGFSENWIELGHHHSFLINDLNPGKYSLEIHASNSDGIWTKTPKQIELIMLPHFFETVWFKILVFLLITLIVFSLYFARMNIINKQKKGLELKINEKTKELKKANEELTLSNSTKDKFFSIIAHDLKSPFNSLLGFSEILQEDWYQMEESKRLEFVQIMHKTQEETYQLLTNLLDWSRLQRNNLVWQPEISDLLEIVEQVHEQVRSIALQKDISIIVTINPKTLVYIDREMIGTVLRNLISNAIKFTQPRGRIMIYIRKTEEWINCYIEDSGVGIDEEILEHLFDFNQNGSTLGTNGEKGTGLGLILCKELIQINKGDISAKSKIGHGSTFCISLPVIKEA